MTQRHPYYSAYDGEGCVDTFCTHCLTTIVAIVFAFMVAELIAGTSPLLKI